MGYSSGLLLKGQISTIENGFNPNFVEKLLFYVEKCPERC